MAAVASPEETLSAEEAGRRPAAIAAFVGAVLTLGYLVISLTAFGDAPSRAFLVSLERIGDGRAIAGDASLRESYFQYFNDRVVAQVAASVLLGIGALGVGFMLRFVARASQARAERQSALTVYLPAAGAIIAAVGSVATGVGNAAFFSDGASTDGTVAAVAAVDPPGFATAAAFVQFFGTLTLGLGYVLVSLNAMKVGLLTRFMGITGVFAGALVLIQGLPAYVIQTFWLVAMGFLLLRVWPGGAIPPAWVTGKSEPWPSPQAERAARQKAAAQRRGAPAPPEPEAVEQRVGSGTPHPSSKKKRKRRS